MAELDGTTTHLNETSRTYRFGGADITFNNVVELTIKPSGSHRLKTADGQLHIVRGTWLAISIVDETADWTV